MKSLLLSDFYNISTIFKQLIFALIILSVTFLSSMGTGGFIVFATCLCGVTVLNLFAMDEKSQWLKYVMIMPITKKQYVYSKYLVTMLFILSGMAGALIISLISSLVGMDVELSGKEIVFYTLSGLGVGIVFISIYIPIMIRYGTEKSRFILVGILLLPSVLGATVSTGVGAPPEWFMKALNNGARILDSREYLLAIFVLGILAISLSLSNRWIEKKEF